MEKANSAQHAYIRRKKVLAYIIRQVNDTPEVLVFEEKICLHLSPQVPAGTVENGEPFDKAVIREVFEETGIQLKQEGLYLGTYDYIRKDVPHLHERHVYAFFKNDLPDEWQHIVSGNGEDKGLLFDYFWMPVDQAREKLFAQMGALLDHPALLSKIA
ncbi:MAG: NUDIX hydrolase [Rickettsiales bacterium]|nr:NUDIX hydrolase [Rickettsiales bacterium]